MDVREDDEGIRQSIKELIRHGYITEKDGILTLTQKGWEASPEELELLAQGLDLEPRDTE